MATPPYVATINMIDSELKEFTRTVFSNAASHGAAVTEIAELVSVIQPLSLCVVRGYSVAQYIPVSNAVPAQDVDGEIQALFNYLNADGKVRSLSIPGFDRSFLIPGTDQVNTTDSLVAAFVSDFIGGTIVDLGNVDITALKSANEHFTKKRKSS